MQGHLCLSGHRGHCVHSGDVGIADGTFLNLFAENYEKEEDEHEEETRTPR